MELPRNKYIETQILSDPLFFLKPFDFPILLTFFSNIKIKKKVFNSCYLQKASHVHQPNSSTIGGICFVSSVLNVCNSSATSRNPCFSNWYGLDPTMMYNARTNFTRGCDDGYFFGFFELPPSWPKKDVDGSFSNEEKWTRSSKLSM